MALDDMKPTGGGRSVNLSALMKTKHAEHNTVAATAKVEVIKLGQDVHAKQVTVAVQYDGATPQPGQKIKVEEYLGWVGALMRRHPGAKVVACYEAGPCGYWLHRQLEKKGVRSYVVAPQNWSGQRKTDSRDARGLVEALDRFESGHRKAFGVVAVPSVEEERRRGLVRHRARLARALRRCAQQGCSLLLLEGIRVRGSWWKPRNWKELAPSLPEVLAFELGQLQSEALLVRDQIGAVGEPIAEAAKQQSIPAPRGVGALTWFTLLVEMIRWDRFENRRQVASYCGLCPSEYSSGATRRQGSIDKHGNPRLRQVLIETVWRLLRWQPGYPPLRRLIESHPGRARRKAAVAVARKLAIDLWRLATGKATLDGLGLSATA
jgi:transposase